MNRLLVKATAMQNDYIAWDEGISFVSFPSQEVEQEAFRRRRELNALDFRVEMLKAKYEEVEEEIGRLKGRASVVEEEVDDDLEDIFAELGLGRLWTPGNNDGNGKA